MDPNFCMTERKVCQWIRSMLLAVQHCHENNIVHRDLKPENFVFKTDSENSDILLVDFGCAKIVQDNVKYHGVSGTPHYIAPEVVAGSKMIRTGRTLKCSDMWSIGVIAYILMIGVFPFSGTTKQSIFNSIMFKPLTFCEGAAKLSESFKDFCKRVLVKSPRRRLTVAEALEHQWVQGRFISPQVLSSTPVRDIAATTIFYSLGSGSHVYRLGSTYILGTCHYLEDLCKGVMV